MLKKGNTKRSSPPAGAKGNGHKLPTNFHELFLVLILVYNYGFVKNFYRLDKILSQARQNFVKGMINFYHRLDNSCCYLLFFLFWFPQGICLGVGLLDHMVVLCLVFKESPYRLS